MTVCPACRFENPAQMRFCGQCGQALTAAERAEAMVQRHLTVLFTDATERALRMIVLGSRLPGRAAQPAEAVPVEVVSAEVVSGTQRPSSVR